MFFNVQGFKKMYDLNSEQQELMNKSEIICMEETWIVEDNVKIPDFLNEYDVISERAIKNHVKGRGSGGIIVLIRKHLNYAVKVSDSRWIFVEVNYDNKKLLLGSAYISQKLNFKQSMGELGDIIRRLTDQLKPDFLMVGGDMNARVGDLNQIEQELDPTYRLTGHRRTMDREISDKGRILVSTLEEFELVMLNGRSPSDREGHLTFRSSVGSSLIDHVWISIPTIQIIADFKVDDFILTSDHLPCIVTLYDDTVNNKEKQNNFYKDIFKWSKESKEVFQATLTRISLAEGDGIEEMNRNLIDGIKQAARCSDMTRVKKMGKNEFKNKIWYGKECIGAKNEMRRRHREWKRDEINNELLELFLKSKLTYKKTVQDCKNAYIDDIRKKFSNTRCPTEFWGAIRKLEKKSFTFNNISNAQWEQFYFAGQQRSLVNRTAMDLQNLNPILDQDITLEEIYNCLDRCKNGKAPGADGLNYEFYKNLPANQKLYMQKMFNKIMLLEKCPTQWGKIELIMLKKKGDKNDLNNYRGISLINNIVKIFSSIIYTRISRWVELNNILPESQCGFRPHRACNDHIFTLTTIINKKLQKPGGKVYISFIDLKKAFDNVDRHKLWERLYLVGISGKIIRIIASLYENIRLQIRTYEGKTSDIPLDRGVLQGDALSPLLFAIYLHDLEKSLLEAGFEGVSVNERCQIISLSYADDIAILSGNVPDLQRKLNFVNRYFLKLGLEININKTKIIEMRKRHTQGEKVIKINDQQIEFVQSHVYLGVIFNRNGNFKTHADYAISNGKKSMHRIKNIIFRIGATNWESCMKMYQTALIPCSLYAVETWGLRYGEELEKVQAAFFKSLLTLPGNTPNYMMRIEFGLRKLKIRILQKALKWIIKVNNLNNSRLPKICLNTMISDYKKNTPRNNDVKYNYLKQLAGFLNADQLDLILGDLNSLKDNIENILQDYDDRLFREDWARTRTSSYNFLYNEIITKENEEGYLNLDTAFWKKKLYARLRLANLKELKLFHNDKVVIIRDGEMCTACGLQAMSMMHVLCECEAFSDTRKKYDMEGDFHKILCADSSVRLEKSCQYIVEIITRL